MNYNILDTSEEKINELVDMTMEFIQNEASREKRLRK